MTERVRPSDSGVRTARGRVPRALRGGVRGPAIPVPPPRDVSVEAEPTILGFPAEPADEGAEAPVSPSEVPASPALVVLRRADPVAAAPLVLAGVAANVSLSL